MKIEKEHIRKILKQYMTENNLGFISLEASLSMDKSNLLLSMTEEEDDINDTYRWN